MQARSCILPLPSYSSFFFSSSSTLRCCSLKILTKISLTDEEEEEEEHDNGKGKGVVKYENSGAHLKVLVVDDDVLTREYHEKLLKRVGVKDYACVKHGQEAVDLYCHGQTFDLILMAEDMPIMNGTLATKKLRSMGIRSIIIGVSYPSRKDVQEFLDAGLDDYYKKPFTEDMLSEILDKIKP